MGNRVSNGKNIKEGGRRKKKDGNTPKNEKTSKQKPVIQLRAQRSGLGTDKEVAEKVDGNCANLKLHAERQCQPGTSTVLGPRGKG